MKRLYWLSRNLPDLSKIPPELRFGTWSIAVQRAHRHWQVWAAYIVLFVGVSPLPAWNIHPGRFVFNVASALHQRCIYVSACEAV